MIIPPMGKMRMLTPGRTNGALSATTKVWIGGWTTVLATVASSAKMPETKDASPVSRVAFCWSPAALRPVRVTVGTRSFSSWDLDELVCATAERRHFTYVDMSVPIRSLLI